MRLDAGRRGHAVHGPHRERGAGRDRGWTGREPVVARSSSETGSAASRRGGTITEYRGADGEPAGPSWIAARPGRQPAGSPSTMGNQIGRIIAERGRSPRFTGPTHRVRGAVGARGADGACSSRSTMTGRAHAAAAPVASQPRSDPAPGSGTSRSDADHAGGLQRVRGPNMARRGRWPPGSTNVVTYLGQARSAHHAVRGTVTDFPTANGPTARSARTRTGRSGSPSTPPTASPGSTWAAPRRR